MDMLLDEILNLEENIQICWEYFVTLKIKEGMEFINKIFDSIERIINRIQNDNLININISQIEIIFVKLEMALKIPDYVLIADLLNYEVKPLIELWRITLNDLQ